VTEEEKINLGHIKKKIQFDDTDRRHIELKLRLHFDGLNQGDFFRAMVTGYIQRHPDIVSYIEVVKNHRKKYTLREKRMAAKSYQEHENIKNKYSLDKEEIENIFDIIKEEQDIS